MLLDGLDCKHGRVEAVAIIRPSSAIQSTILEDRLCGSLTLLPSLHVRLLIEVPVEQHTLILELTFHLDQQQG